MSINKLYECIKKKNANNSRTREAIYTLLLNTKECLNVSQITNLLKESYPKKISHNTLYRHLNFFIECNLVVVIQDDFKRAFYHINEEKMMTFCVCTNCKNVTKMEIKNFIQEEDFKDTKFITVHKLCHKCKGTVNNFKE